MSTWFIDGELSTGLAAHLGTWNSFGPHVGMNLCACVSAHEGINNQKRDMVWYS